MGDRREDERSSGSTEQAGEGGELSGSGVAPGKQTLTGGWGDEPRARHELEDPSAGLQGTAELGGGQTSTSETPALRRDAGGGKGGGGGAAPAVKPAEIGENVEGWVVYANTARKGGSVSWRCQNPGNIMVSAEHINDGGMYGDLKRTLGPYRIFATYAQGRQGFFNFVHGWAPSGRTIKGMAYLPYGDKGLQEVYVQLWTSVSGAKASTKLKDLTEAQIDAMATATQNQEGWTPGIEASRSDPPGPGKPARVFLGTPP
jgi:hypothetical protein